MRPLLCRFWRITLIARVLDTGYPPAFLDSHVGTCLRCQATVAHSQRLRRTLASLRPRAVGVSPEGSTVTAPWMMAALASALAAVLWARTRNLAS